MIKRNKCFSYCCVMWSCRHKSTLCKNTEHVLSVKTAYFSLSMNVCCISVTYPLPTRPGVVFVSNPSNVFSSKAYF